MPVTDYPGYIVTVPANPLVATKAPDANKGKGQIVTVIIGVKGVSGDTANLGAHDPVNFAGYIVDIQSLSKKAVYDASSVTDRNTIDYPGLVGPITPLKAIKPNDANYKLGRIWLPAPLKANYGYLHDIAGTIPISVSLSGNLSSSILVARGTITITTACSATATLQPFPAGDGTAANPYQVFSLEELQRVGSYLSNYFKLMADIDATPTATWNARPGYPGEYYGFVPIGAHDQTPAQGADFTGAFDGDNHTINGLYINRQNFGPSERPLGFSSAGLFGKWAPSSSVYNYIKNINLTNVNITGYTASGVIRSADGDYVTIHPLIDNCTISGTIVTVNSGGGIVGDLAFGTLSNSSSSANISAATALWLGCLAGYVDTSTVSNCNASGTVTGANSVACGGLIGSSYSSTISNSYSTGAVSGKLAGGFIGETTGDDTITLCHSTGAVSTTATSGTTTLGGFAGSVDFNTTILSCYATGNVTHTNSLTTIAGGFIGSLSGSGISISFSASTGNITFDTAAGVFLTLGGFIGNGGASGTTTIEKCYATGNISAAASTLISVGGFMGEGYNLAVEDCYSKGSVLSSGTAAANPNIGGFCGNPSANITFTRCYSKGAVKTGAFSNGGGFIGLSTFNPADAVDCYWDTQTSGWATSPAGTGKTTAEMKTQATYSGWDFVTVWEMPVVG